MTGEDLRLRRQALGLTQVELADAISTPAMPVSNVDISRWERGVVRITPLRAAWLQQALIKLEPVQEASLP